MKLHTRAEMAKELGLSKFQMTNLFAKIRIAPKQLMPNRTCTGLYCFAEVKAAIDALPKSRPNRRRPVDVLHNAGYEGESIPTIARLLKCCENRLRRIVHGTLSPVASFGTVSIFDVEKVRELYLSSTQLRGRKAKRSRHDYDRTVLANKRELTELLGIGKVSLSNYIARARIAPAMRLYGQDGRITIYDIETVKAAIGQRKLATLEARRNAAAHMRELRKAKDQSFAQRMEFARQPLEMRVAALRAKGLKVFAIAKELAEPVDKVCRLVEAYDKAREAENMENK